LGESSVPAHCFLEGNTIYSNVDRTMMAIDLKTGETIWERYDMCAYTCQDVLFFNDVLMKCAVNATIGYDKKNGEVKYLFDDYGSWYVSQEGRYAYFINCKNVLDILDIETGQKLDYIECPNKRKGFFGSYPMIYDDKLYIIGNNTLYRYPTYPWK
jgi:outer membrane protein assembly factor BamB